MRVEKSFSDTVRLFLILLFPCSIIRGWVCRITAVEVASEEERLTARQKGIRPLGRFAYWVMWPYIQDECKHRGITPTIRKEESTMWKYVKKFFSFFAKFGEALAKAEKMAEEVPGGWIQMP